MRYAIPFIAAALLAGCASTGASQPSPSGEAPQSITVLTHASVVIPDDLLATFEKEQGVDVTVQQLQDAGAMTNQLILTKDSPLGDVVYGIDNTFASRAEAEGIIDAYVSPALEDGAPEPLAGMTPVDFSDVCVNADLTWFEKDGRPLPATLDDLAKPEYKGLFVAPSPATSSPGLAFLFATIGEKSDGWQDYWRSLKANGLLTVSGWTEAYHQEFTAGEGAGEYPLVVSYASSPAFSLVDGKPTTVSLPKTCFRQVEYAGVLKGAANPEGAKKFVDFLLGPEFQKSIPNTMYVYPANPSTPLSDDWAKAAPLSDSPITLDPAAIDANREEWIRAWSDLG